MDDLGKYIALLNAIQSKYRALHKDGASFASLSDYNLAYQEQWKQSGVTLFSYFKPLDSGAIVRFVDFIAVGGECIIAKGRDSKSGQFYTAKIALAPFNEPDERLVKKSTFWGKDKETIRQNEFRIRFFKGINSQRKACSIFQQFKFGAVPKVVYLSTEAPVYTILEWIDGKNFADFVRANFELKDGKRQIVHCFWKILQCYRRLHSYGIIHRDVKPENILIDNYNNISLIDFVVVKDLTTQSDLTVSGTYLGDMRYSPPEQVLYGQSQISTFKSDVYSLGQMLYFILTSKHPPTHVHEKRLRLEQKNNIPAVFRTLFDASTQETIEKRPDIERFIAVFEEICRQEGINFEIVEEIDADPISDGLVDFVSLRDRVEKLEKILRSIGVDIEKATEKNSDIRPG